MTIITGQGLNTTTGLNKTNVKSSKNKKSEVEDNGGRLDTMEDELDLNMIKKTHTTQMSEKDKKEAFGVSHNIFDVSSYGEVRLNNPD